MGDSADTAALTGQAVRERGITGSELPVRGALAVTVPGAAALWEDTIKAFGKLPLAEVGHVLGVSWQHPAAVLACSRGLRATSLRLVATPMRRGAREHGP